MKVISKITGKEYNSDEAVYCSNMLQMSRYFAYLGDEYFLDIIWSDRKKDSLVFVWKKCPETKRAKELWDQHLL